MNNSKFIRVKVSETADQFENKLLEFETANSKIKYVKTCLHVANGLFTGYELKEVPDYEDEMKEMLEFIYGYGEKVEWSKVKPKLEELLTKLKTDS